MIWKKFLRNKLMEITEETILGRHLCPNLCQVTIFEGKKCEKCGKDMEYIGDFNENELDKELGKLQLAKIQL